MAAKDEIEGIVAELGGEQEDTSGIDQGVVTVDVSDDDTESGDDEPPVPPPQPGRPGRAQRRKDRYSLAQSERDQARRELEIERQEKEDLRRRLAEVEARTNIALETVQRATQSPASREEQLRAAKRPILERKQALANEWHSLSDEQKAARASEFHERGEAIEQELTRVRIAAELPNPEEAQRRQQEQAFAARVAEVQARYADVVRDPRAFAKAREYWSAAEADGKELTQELAEECYRKARVWRQGGKPDIEYERQRTGGLRASRGEPKEGPRTVQMTRAMRDIAEMQYPGLKPADAHRKWARDDAEAYLEKKAEIHNRPASSSKRP